MTDGIRQNDLLPAWSATLKDAGVPIDLLAGGVTSIAIEGQRDCDETPYIVDVIPGPYSALGYIERPWLPGETATAGTVHWKVVVTWPGGRPQTFPLRSSEKTVIYPA